MKNNKQQFGDLGQHWTPPETVEFMVSLIQNNGSILEPSAGSGRFLDALPDHTVALEFDPSVTNPKHNYIIGNFFDYSTDNKFDTIIGNPPYVAGKLLDDNWFSNYVSDSPRTANAYIHFIDKCINHLKPHGELIMIVPDTLLGGTSYGSVVRSKFKKYGSITHYYTPDTKWDKANVGTCIFRFQKCNFSETVITEIGNKTITYNDGFYWIIDYDYKGIFDDYFDITVGSVPSPEIIDSPNASTPYFTGRNGNIMVDESDKTKFSRYRTTKKKPKIFFDPGPTRKDTLFWSGDNPNHTCFVMIPKNNLDINIIEEMTKQLNQWFKDNSRKVGLRNDGRFGVGVSQLKSMPFPTELYNENLAPNTIENFFE